LGKLSTIFQVWNSFLHLYTWWIFVLF